MKDMMYLNDDIKIDFPMSKVLKEVIDEAEKYYEEDDWVMYDLKVHEMEGTSKQDVLSGFITTDQMYLIWERYGI